MKIKMTRNLAWAAGCDEANRNAKRNGRKQWTLDDYRAGGAVFAKLWPLEMEWPKMAAA